MSVSARLVETITLNVETDFSQWWLYADPRDVDLAHRLVDRASVDGIAQEGSLTFVWSPTTTNDQVLLTLEIWSSAPDPDLAVWEEVVEAHIEVGDTGLTFESPTMGSAELPVPQGAYHALISGRGFTDEDVGEPSKGEHWRIQMWPSSGPPGPARLVTSRDTSTPIQALYLDAGRAAARRINRDLQSGKTIRSLEDQNGTASASYRYAATRRKLFKEVAGLAWWTAGTAGQGPIEVSGGFTISANPVQEDHFDGLPTGSEESIRTPERYRSYELRGTYLEVQSPAKVTIEMQWWVMDLDLQTVTRTTNALLAQPTTLRISLDETKVEGERFTTVHVEHSSLPPAWADDMTAVWKCKLEAGHRVYGLDR